MKEQQEKMKQCSAGAAAGIDLCLELLCTAEERVFCCSSSRDKMYSAVVRVGRFNRWLLLLLLLGFRIPELNWSLQRPCCHTALQCTASLGSTGTPVNHCKCNVKLMSGALQCSSAVALAESKVFSHLVFESRPFTFLSTLHCDQCECDQC